MCVMYSVTCQDFNQCYHIDNVITLIIMYVYNWSASLINPAEKFHIVEHCDLKVFVNCLYTKYQYKGDYGSPQH